MDIYHELSECPFFPQLFFSQKMTDVKGTIGISGKLNNTFPHPINHYIYVLPPLLSFLVPPHLLFRITLLNAYNKLIHLRFEFSKLIIKLPSFFLQNLISGFVATLSYYQSDFIFLQNLILRFLAT